MFTAANASLTLISNPCATNKEKQTSESRGGTDIEDR